MDLNIDNYNDNDIYNLFKLNKYDCNIDKLLEVISYNKNLISNSQLDNKIDHLDFLDKCFIRLSNKNFDINNKMCLPKLNNYINPNTIHKQPIINNSFANKNFYPQTNGISTSILLINSKFRENTNSINYLNKFKSDKLNMKKRCLNYNSNSNTNTNTDFTIQLTEPYNNVISLKLAAVELVNSYYSISEYLKTNEFTITLFEYNINDKTDIININENTFNISSGSYDSTYIIAKIQEFLNIYYPNLIFINIDNNNSKINLYINNNFKPNNKDYNYGFNLDFNIKNYDRPPYLNFGWLIGFKNIKYDFFNDYIDTPTNDLKIGFNSESPVNLLGSTFYLLEIDDYNNNHSKVVNYNINSPYSFNINNIIAKIPNMSETNTLFFEDSSDRIFKTRKYKGPVKIKKLRFRLLDENGRVLDLNNSDIVYSIEIKTIHD